MEEDITVKVDGLGERVSQTGEPEVELIDDGVDVFVPVQFTGDDGYTDWGNLWLRVEDGQFRIELPGR